MGETGQTKLDIIDLNTLESIGNIPFSDMNLFDADAEAINAKNEVVGWILPTTDGIAQGFLYDIEKQALSICKLNEKIGKDIKNMTKMDAYYHGFSQGKKNMLRTMTRTNRRNVRYVNTYKKNTEQTQYTQ